MAGTLAFSRFVIKDVFRNRGRTLTSIIGVVLTVSLIAGENIALDTSANNVLDEELENNGYDYYTSSKKNFNEQQQQDMSKEILAVDGVEEVLIFLSAYNAIGLYGNSSYEIHNNPPIYGYYDNSVDVSIPVNSIVRLDTTLEQIPLDTYKLHGYVLEQESGEPIQDAIINIEEGDHVGYSITNRTNNQGYYEFNLPEGDFNLELSYNIIGIDYLEIILSTQVTIKSSESEKRLDFQFPKINSSIQGYILDPITGSPYNGEFSIYLINQTEKTNSTIEFKNKFTTYDGSFNLNSISGNMTLYGAAYNGIIDNFQIEIPPDSSVVHNITLAPPLDESVTIEGYVYDNLSKQPLGSAHVLVTGIDKRYENESNTDDFGHFLMNVIPGNISISIEQNTSIFNERKYMKEEIIIFNSAEDTLNKDIYLEPMTSILNGYVTWPLGENIENLDVRLEGTKIEKKQTSNYEGRGYYEIEVPAGNYTVTFDAPPRKSPFIDSRAHSIFGINPSSDQLEFLQDIFKFDINGSSLNLGHGNIAITKELADKNALGIGSQVILTDEYFVWDETKNIEILKEITLFYTVSAIIVPQEYIQFNILMSMDDLRNFISDFVDFDPTLRCNTNIRLRIDRERYIDLFFKGATEVSLTQFSSRLNAKASKFDLSFNNHLESPLNSYYNWMDRVRLELIAYSLPVIGIGLYLGVIGIRLNSGQKRRVIGIMKSRGASNKQIFLSLIIEAVVMGIIAGFIGLIFGGFASRFMLTAIPSSRNTVSSPDIFSINITGLSIIISIIFAITLMVAASYRPIRHASKLTIIQSLHHQVEVKNEKKYKPVRDVFLVSFSVFVLIVVSQVELRYLDPVTSGYFFWAFIYYTYWISIAWVPISPFIMIFALTMLLTKGTKKIYKIFSRVVKPFTGNLWFLIDKSIVKNPKRVSSVTIIIALSLAFGVFMTTMIATTIYGQELEVRTEIGADLKVSYLGANISMENELEEIEGINSVISVKRVEMQIQNEVQGFSLIDTILFNATKYAKYIEIPDYFFAEGSPDEALRSLRKGSSIIITHHLARLNSWSIGSTLRIERIIERNKYPLYLKNSELKVVGIVNALPGLGPERLEKRVYIDFRALEELPNDARSNVRFLVDVEDGYDSKTVEHLIIENFGTFGLEIRNLKEEIETVRNDLSSRPILNIMFIDIAFVIIIITAGLALILFISINERKNELATIIARGADMKQVSLLIVGEAFAIAMIGVVIGVSTGIFTAYMFNEISEAPTFFSLGGSILPGRPLIIPWIGFLIVFLAIISLTIVSILSSYKVKKMDLNKELRARGG